MAGKGARSEGRRREGEERVEERRGADAVAGGRERHREDLAVGDGAAQARLQVFLGEGAGLEEAFHQLVVGLGHGLDEAGAVGLDLVGQGGGDVRGSGLAVAVAGEAVGLLGHQVDDTGKAGFLADGDLDGERTAAEALLEAFEGAGEVGPLAVHLGQVEEEGLPDLRGEVPDALGVDLDAGHAVDAEEHGVGGAQALLGLGEEDAVPGAVEQVDLVLLPGDEAGGHADRDLALDLFVVEVGERVAVFHPVQPGRDTAGKEERAD